MIHSYLAQQLEQLGLSESCLPPTTEAWQQFLGSVSCIYSQSDRGEHGNFLTSVLKCLDAGFCWLDCSGCLQSINPEGARLLGWSEAELLGKNFLEFVEVKYYPPSSSPNCQAVIADLTVSQKNTTFRCKDNRYLQVSYILNWIVEQGSPVGAVLVFFERRFSDFLQESIQKEFEEALYRSEMNNRALINAIPDLMFRLNKDGYFLDFKAPKSNFLEDLGGDKFIGTNISAALPDDVFTTYLHFLEQALLTEKVQVFEYQLLLNNHVCEYETRLVKSGLDEVLAIVRDITDRKTAEKALLESEEKYRSVVDNIKEVIFKTNSKGFFTFLNPAWTELTGYAQKESLGMNFLDFIDPAERPLLRQVVKQLIKGQETFYRAELRYLTKRGSVRWFSVHVTLLWDYNKLMGSFGTLNDITEQKYAENSLKYRIEFENLITNLSTKFINLAANEIEAGINHALQEIGIFCGVDRSYVFRFLEDQSFLQNTHEWCAAGIESQIQTLQKVPISELSWLVEKLCRFENVYVPLVTDLPPEADREKHHFQSQSIQSLIVVPMVCGRSLMGFVGFDSVRDQKTWLDESISLLKMVAEMLANTLERQRTEKELERVAQAAEAANRAKSIFLANMSHELRTPLNAIIGYSEIIKEEAEDLGYVEVNSDLDKIRSAGYHLLNLINDILDISKIEAGRMDLYIEEFDIAILIDEIVNTIRPLVQKNQNTLKVLCDPDIGRMAADITKVRQVLLNLLSNAAKFTENGTITLWAKIENGRGDDLGSSSVGRYVVFTVSDTGIGIPKEQLETIFEPFTQADVSTTRKYGGTGLGLAIGKRFCEMMGGNITLTSQCGVGSTFTVVLPANIQP
ncbi:PAS domain S-box protein [Ancylothrix sp. C2]|uniref:PAS domain S-box protein n=1 Tax=Ancylothrix sp. D3o TaxID=2953691 RepID=UPI0021BA967C|nr:PAS domain S-box protein [Ancylothrix sp. D3o]MCT7949688.1 PAS domain S-box protein [Ancylothrix sp. D3o]